VPTYEYACDPCRVIFQTRHGMRETGPDQCPRCTGGLRKVLSAPGLNLKNFGGPTEAKYSSLTVTEELAREKVLQSVYETIWIPAPIKHNPWDEDH